MRGLDIRSQGILHGPASLQRSQDDVRSYRRAPENLVTESIRESVQDCGASASYRRFSDAARTAGRFGVGEVNSAPPHPFWYGPNTPRLAVVGLPDPAP